VGRPDWTAEKFLPDPFAARLGSCMYRTGDLARMRGDGAFEFQGRVDQQVKIRGFRVEIGEVQAALAGCPGVRDVAVVAAPDPNGGVRLIAHIVPTSDTQAPDGWLLRHFCHGMLPEHMIPSVFLFRSALPLTPNGKVDLKLLIDTPQLVETTTSPPVEPRTPLEELLVQIYSEVLKRPIVGIFDNFFQLGGHSLLATRVISRIRAKVGLEVPLRSMFEAPTVAELARNILELQANEAGPVALEKLLHQVEGMPSGNEPHASWPASDTLLGKT